MRNQAVVVSLGYALALLARAETCGAEPQLDDVRINQLQYIGTHNSYHLAPSPEQLEAFTRLNRRAKEWDYEHAPLDTQLDRGVRSFELDLHYNGRAFEVFHVPRFDTGSSCPKFDEALKLVRSWSDEHARHVPISFLLEIKEDLARLDRRLQAVDGQALDQIDAAIRAVFPAERLITPDDVRADAASLREAVTEQGWPTLAAARGRVLFILHERGALRDAYVAEHPSLAGRAMFVNSSPDRDDAATLIVDSPEVDRIQALVEQGFWIRTRADANLNPVDDASFARRDAALASGAHIISTDYPAGEAHADSDYVVAWPDGAEARVNPVNGPEQLSGHYIEAE